MTNLNFQDLLDFWFAPEHKALWFNSTPEFDEALRQRFEATYDAAVEGQLQDWQQSAKGALALVILFDQIPLNIFRGKAKSFSTEALARDVAHNALKQKFHETMKPEQKAFLFMPFMHSESMEDQNLSVELFTDAGLNENARYARHHRDIVQRFGRFPHRNTILGRESTPEEISYLSSKEAFHG